MRTCPLALKTTDDDPQITHEPTTGDVWAFVLLNTMEGFIKLAWLSARSLFPHGGRASLGALLANDHERQLVHGTQAQATKCMPFACPPACMLISVLPTRTLVPLPRLYAHPYPIRLYALPYPLSQAREAPATSQTKEYIIVYRTILAGPHTVVCPRATPPTLPALEMSFAMSIGVCNDVARRNGGTWWGSLRCEKQPP
ncbi:hypothetical protein BD779DRAFT_1675928 [Infundibulicybe gibba]|nr:hypothetical protein BD779DRAFT_1675928 [Infundibulicybe gibba]